jgi:hypothetical protein
MLQFDLSTEQFDLSTEQFDLSTEQIDLINQTHTTGVSPIEDSGRIRAWIPNTSSNLPIPHRRKKANHPWAVANPTRLATTNPRAVSPLENQTFAPIIVRPRTTINTKHIIACALRFSTFSESAPFAGSCVYKVRALIAK